MKDQVQILKNQLNELKLRHLAASIEQILLDSRGLDKPYSQYLQDVLSVEIEKRRENGIKKRLKAAGLPVFDKHLDLDLYDFSCRTGISKRQILELSSQLLWIDRGYNIMFLGGSGLGKSFLASYIGYSAIQEGYHVSYVTLHQLVHLLRTQEALSRSRTKLKRIKSCDLLILDEIGNTMLDRQERNLLFQLLMDFYQKTSLITISNKGFDDWAKTLGDQVSTAAIMDRLLHHCEVFNLGGESWRLEKKQTILADLLPELDHES